MFVGCCEFWCGIDYDVVLCYCFGSWKLFEIGCGEIEEVLREVEGEGEDVGGWSLRFVLMNSECLC